MRIPNFFPTEVAEHLRDELLRGLVYERVELSDVTRQSRARRPIGDVYFGPMQRREGWRGHESVGAALGCFESQSFVSWLSDIAGEPLRFLRPVTAYRMDRGDRLALHDDMSDGDHAVSVAYNLSRDWQPEWGGATVVGEVTHVTPLETPPDSPIDLQQWHVTNAVRFLPDFNSLLIMRLAHAYAHGVDEVTGDEPRLALVGIYGRESSWS